MALASNTTAFKGRRARKSPRLEATETASHRSGSSTSGRLSGCLPEEVVDIGLKMGLDVAVGWKEWLETWNSGPTGDPLFPPQKLLPILPAR